MLVSHLLERFPRYLWFVSPPIIEVPQSLQPRREQSRLHRHRSGRTIRLGALRAVEELAGDHLHGGRVVLPLRSLVAVAVKVVALGGKDAVVPLELAVPISLLEQLAVRIASQRANIGDRHRVRLCACRGKECQSNQNTRRYLKLYHLGMQRPADCGFAQRVSC